ncbi:addiction module protein [Roseiconus nitratireducens]|uniref:Addiction module protein n=1 Tax=Roseiconus nitratireducens TaxID=2605748 RepID=A0A5M6CUX7_9BACT|nr:addiction module protein [Roseiconus nitratireducens]KAA5539001.1 addiction module protein [Roseiconus nitratireducens]
MEPQQLARAALSLPEAQRAELAVSLINSLEPPSDRDADAEWAAEIHRRIESLDAGTAKLFPAADVFAEMKRRRNG